MKTFNYIVWQKGRCIIAASFLLIKNKASFNRIIRPDEIKVFLPVVSIAKNNLLMQQQSYQNLDKDDIIIGNIVT